MRTIADIKKQMTDQIMSDVYLQQALNLDTSQTWEAQTSKASVLNIILYIVATACYSIEWLFGQFKNDVEDRIAAALPGTISWYWNKAMEFQDDEEASAYFAENGSYQIIDESKQIIKHVSVVEEYNTVNIKVNAAGYKQLTDEQLTRFSAYMEELKFAGTWLNISSLQSDDLTITVRIWRNRLLMPSDNDEAVGTAIRGYLDNIVYGGVFNKTKLIDRIQQVQGIDDVTIEDCVFTAHDTNNTVHILTSQNYRSTAGHINLQNLIVHYE